MTKIMEIKQPEGLEEFAAFILTHGRPKKNKTYSTLKKHGYTGRIVIVIDNEDSTGDEYREEFGEQVVVFDKEAIARTFDTGDNQKDKRTIVYARNACFEIAKEMGIKYFIQLDDDYNVFAFKFNSDLEYGQKNIQNLDKVFRLLLDYYKSIDCLTIAIAQTGDFLGGGKGSFGKEIRLRRKAMNTFICSTERPFKFLGRINEDVNTYTNLGSKGHLFLTVPNLVINQVSTQQNKGGMTDVYLDGGTYVKSFYTVMYCPSSVRVAMMGETNRRLHHKVNWKKAVPMVLHEKWKK